jgi:hypothetical protein
LTGVVNNYRPPEFEVLDVPDDLLSTVSNPTAEDLVRLYGALDEEARSVENNAGLPFHEMDWFDENRPEFAARTPHPGSSSSESEPPAMTDSADLSHDEDDNGLPLRETNTHIAARVYSEENPNIFERFTEGEGAHNADAGDDGEEAGVMYEEEEHADTDLEEEDTDAEHQPREVSNWFDGELDPPEDVELEGHRMPINVFDHAQQLQQPSPDAFCSFSQGGAEEETEADGVHWWVRTRACSHIFIRRVLVTY